MADYIQLGCIAYDDLENDEQREWLENLDPEFNRCFVQVLEGDASKVYAFDQNEILTIDKLIDSDYCDGCYVAVDKVLTDESEIARLDAVRDRSNASLFAGMIYFQPVE